VNEQDAKFDRMSDKELDRLLASAHWPAPDAGAEPRLAAYWRSLRPASTMRYWAVAAGVLVAIGIWGVWQQVHRSQIVAPHPSIVRRGGAQPNDLVAEVTTPARVVGRPATALELAMFQSVQRRPRKEAGRVPDVATFVVWRAIMLSESGSEDRAIALLKRMDPRVLESRWPHVLNTAGGHKKNIAGLLVATATPRSLPLLLQLDGSPDTRDAAIEGLARVAPPGMLVTLARSHSNARQRRELITGLLRREPSEVAGGYLELVRDPATSHDALACLDDVRPSTDVFFARLDDPRIAIREAAASVLGRIDGPQTTARLIDMARRNRNRREALLALADSRGPEARRFLATNDRSGPLAGPIRSVLLQQDRIR